MHTIILRALRATALAWWRHRDLRRSGNIDEARRLERKTIRRDLGYLRAAIHNPNAYVSFGGGGTILHLGLTIVSTGAPLDRFPLANLAVRLGTPLIDLRPVEDIIALANLPRVTMDGKIDSEPWEPSSKVSLITYLDAVEPLGGRITNDPRKACAT